MNRNDHCQGGFTLIELTITTTILVVMLVGLGATSGIATRSIQANELRAEGCERVMRCLQRITQHTRAGVLSTYKVEATAADVAAARAPTVGAWIDPLDGEPRSVVQFRAADGILAMNASSLTPPIELRFQLDEAEDPAVRPTAVAGQDDDGDGLIDEGHFTIVYDGVRTGLLTGIESMQMILDGSLLTVKVLTARHTTANQQFFFEQVFSLRNN